MQNNPHEGHRDRMKEEFLANGITQGMPAHKILELLLFYCVPRVDTNPLAHQLIAKYKNISGVLDAPINELLEFKGLTRKNVGLLKMIMPLARIYRVEKQGDMDAFNNFDEMCRCIVDRFSGLTTERLGILYVDSAGHNKGFEFISEGDSSTVGISTRDIIKRVLDNNASAIVMAHNHPTGVALPSSADVLNTETVANAMANINARLLDHIVVVEGDYISMRQSRDYSYIFE